MKSMVGELDDCERGVHADAAEMQATGLPSTALSEATTYEARLFRFGTASRANQLSNSVADPPFVLLFRELYAMAILDLGRQLADIRAEIFEARRNSTDAKRSEGEDRQARLLKLLHQYCDSHNC